MPVFASMLAFITYSLTDHGLNPAPIFSSLALFNSLRIPLNFLPLVIGQVIDANASVRRIQEFLLAEEAEEDTEWNYEAKEAVVIRDADFTWERHPTREDEDSSPNKKGLPGKKPKKEKKTHQESAQSAGDPSSDSVSKRAPLIIYPKQTRAIGSEVLPWISEGIKFRTHTYHPSPFCSPYVDTQCCVPCEHETQANLTTLG